MALHGRILDLGKYRSKLEQLAGASPLASEPAFARHLHIPFSVLYDLVRNARNDALHQGAYVRHLTRHAVSLSLVLEDALMSQHDTCVGNLVYDGSDGNQPVNDVEEAMEKLRAVWEEATRAGRDRST